MTSAPAFQKNQRQASSPQSAWCILTAPSLEWGSFHRSPGATSTSTAHPLVPRSLRRLPWEYGRWYCLKTEEGFSLRPAFAPVWSRLSSRHRFEFQAMKIKSLQSRRTLCPLFATGAESPLLRLRETEAAFYVLCWVSKNRELSSDSFLISRLLPSARDSTLAQLDLPFIQLCPQALAVIVVRSKAISSQAYFQTLRSNGALVTPIHFQKAG